MTDESRSSAQADFERESRHRGTFQDRALEMVGRGGYQVDSVGKQGDRWPELPEDHTCSRSLFMEHTMSELASRAPTSLAAVTPRLCSQCTMR